MARARRNVERLARPLDSGERSPVNAIAPDKSGPGRRRRLAGRGPMIDRSHNSRVIATRAAAASYNFTSANSLSFLSSVFALTNIACAQLARQLFFLTSSHFCVAAGISSVFNSYWLFDFSCTDRYIGLWELALCSLSLRSIKSTENIFLNFYRVAVNNVGGI